MANSYFQFKKFTIHQQHCAMKVTTDGCLFGAWIAFACNENPDYTGTIPSVLDVGTGTGLLSLMLSQKLNCVIDAIEIDEASCAQANDNVNGSPWKNNINVIHADAKNFTLTKRYDIIASNPPFYEKDLRSGNISKNKAHHDESLLLHELLVVIKENMSTTGRFFLLLPYRRNKEMEKIFNAAGLHIHQKIFVSSSKTHQPFRIMVEGATAGDNDKQTLIEEMVIKNEQGKYTEVFTRFLKDYYLHL